MYRYILYGMCVVTDMEFPQLVPYSGEVGYPEITMLEGEIPDEIQERTDVKYEFGMEYTWLKNKTLYIVVEKGERITYCLTGGGTPAYAGTSPRGWGMAMPALPRGRLPIHCSAVADENGAILIAGESGAGKSTLTAAFLEAGYRLMADDMAYVQPRKGELALASPAFPYQKLCRNVIEQKKIPYDNLIYIDEDKDKFLVPYGKEFRTDSVPVVGFLLLAIEKGVLENNAVKCKEIDGLDRFYALANNLFLRHILKEQKYNPEIGQLCLTAAAQLPAGVLMRHQRKDTTEEIVQRAFSLVKKWRN